MSKDVSLISYDKEIEIISKCEHYSTDFHNMFGDIRSLHVRLTPLVDEHTGVHRQFILLSIIYERPRPVNHTEE